MRPNRLLASVLVSGSVLLGGVVLAVAGLPAGSAMAHDQLVSVDPPAGSTVPAPPAVATFTFSEDVAAELTLAAVTPPGGPVVDLPAGRLPAVGAVVTVPLAELAPAAPAGTWNVVLRIVSSDGHPVESILDFAAGPGPDAAPTATTQPAEPAVTSGPSSGPTTQPATQTTSQAAQSFVPTTAPDGAVDVDTAAADGDGLSTGVLAAIVIAVVVAVGGAVAFGIARRP